MVGKHQQRPAQPDYHAAAEAARVGVQPQPAVAPAEGPQREEHADD